MHVIRTELKILFHKILPFFPFLRFSDFEFPIFFHSSVFLVGPVFTSGHKKSYKKRREYRKPFLRVFLMSQANGKYLNFSVGRAKLPCSLYCQCVIRPFSRTLRFVGPEGSCL